ncbi:MAG TPA: hypothetical protein VKS79_10545 [Gemmataceae bacterium]|nr:hypothetical protein [Gemmataceae bacterium]
MFRFVIIAFLALLIPQSVWSADSEKKKVPNEKDQKTALAEIKRIFKDEYLLKPIDRRRAFAQKLLKQGMETEDDAPSQFVLLREARGIAADLGFVDLALKANEELVNRFEVNEDLEKAATLSRSAPNAKADALQTIAEESLAVAAKAVKADDYDHVTEYVELAERCAGRVNNVALRASVRQRKQDFEYAKEKFKQVGKFADQLKADPKNAEANLEMGKYGCFVKNDWETGLERLTKGSDPALKELAEQSLDKDATPDQVAKLASRWWDMAEKLKGLEREHVRLYCGELYRAALPNLTGLKKTQAEQRIAEIDKTALERSGKKEVNLINLLDLSKDIADGNNKWRVDKNVLSCVEGNFWPRVQFPYQPPQDYDYSITFAQNRLRNGVALIMPNRLGGMFSVIVGSKNGNAYRLFWGNDNNMPGLIRPGVKYSFTAQVRKDAIKVYLREEGMKERKIGELDDIRKLKNEGNWSKIEPGVVGLSADDPCTFFSVQITEYGKPGKKLR